MNYSHYQPETTFTNVAPPDDGQEGDGLVPAGPLDPSLAEWGYPAFNPYDAFAYTNQSAPMPLLPSWPPSPGGESSPNQWDLYGGGGASSNDSQANLFAHTYVPDDLRTGVQPDGSYGQYPAQSTQSMTNAMPPTGLQPSYSNATDEAGLQGFEVPDISQWEHDGCYIPETERCGAVPTSVYPHDPSLPPPTSMSIANAYQGSAVSPNIVGDHTHSGYQSADASGHNIKRRGPRRTPQIGFRTVTLAETMDMDGIKHGYDADRSTHLSFSSPSEKDLKSGVRGWQTEVLNKTDEPGSDSRQSEGWKVEFVGANPVRREYTREYQDWRKKQRGKTQGSRKASS